MTQTKLEEIHPLFNDVQLGRVFPDGKTFVDCLPTSSIEEINTLYLEQKDQPGFDLKNFVLAHFELPQTPSNGYTSDPGKSLEENIDTLWTVLTRQPDTKQGSLIPLPYPYVVPGGRFGEIYYWDSYFTMLGLTAGGKDKLLEAMVKNFAYLIDTVGHIPNGNRTYYLSRSQPPFFSLMVQLLASIKGRAVIKEYLPQLEKEYRFWMEGEALLGNDVQAHRHLVNMPDGTHLNRFWDEKNEPRPESFRDDYELGAHAGGAQKDIFFHLRAGAESGWDFSSRWLKDAHSLASIHTCDIVPVDLNCLLLELESTIAEGHALNSNPGVASTYHARVENRKAAIQHYCWDDGLGFYFDYDLSTQQRTSAYTLAAIAPLFFKIANEEQAARVANIIGDKFLRAGGLVTTLVQTDQQWDAPNGWAPLQWMAITGFENYGYTDLAREIANRWIKLNSDVFKRTGKLMEKYNVIDTNLEAGGGEYPGQDGFGWTNGVLLALLHKYGPAS